MPIFDYLKIGYCGMFSDMEQTYGTPPPQLLKWVGNKQRMAAQIVQYFPQSFGTYFEPFLGSGAVLGAVGPVSAQASDVLEPLIEIWQSVLDDPDGLVASYDYYRSQLEAGNDKKEVYESALAEFNRSRRGKDFVYLSRACYGGVIRFRKADGYMSTPVGAHTPISTASFRDRVYKWRERVRGTKFSCRSYEEAFEAAGNGDLIYCDPPYVDTQKILYGAQRFALSDLIERIEDAKSRGVMVALSIDGSKRSGLKQILLDIPDGLFEAEVDISVGASMLRRFQLDGQTMLGEQVTDRLLLTYEPDRFLF
ncbi:DNA adenine methylase [Arcanobacterium wilhelmae]|uniref:Site-specific DNA-methyltransferase (adenine-specific) n=2 Tax=Arcanobacterium wilhelmae TaxID=1803177 RepID=A0ABT9NCR8_9ACTO|nr:DNA adenine methylase [Arcanobacterium wilhelmae]